MRSVIITCFMLAMAMVVMATSLQVTWKPGEGEDPARGYTIYYITPSGSGWQSKARGQIGLAGTAYEHTMGIIGTMGLYGTTGVPSTTGLISIATTAYGPYAIYVTAWNSAGTSPKSDMVLIYYTGR